MSASWQQSERNRRLARQLFSRFNFQTANHPRPSLRAIAKQSTTKRKSWIASSQELLAMTARSRYDFAFSRRECARVMHSHFARHERREGAGDPQERAQGMPGARCTHGFVQKARGRHHRFTGFNPALPAQWFYGFLRALPGDRLYCHRRCAKTFPHNLTPASGRQDHTTSPSASAPLVFARCSRPSHPVPNVRDDRETPLWRDGMARYEPVIWVRDQQQMLRHIGTTGKSVK